MKDGTFVCIADVSSLCYDDKCYKTISIKQYRRKGQEI